MRILLAKRPGTGLHYPRAQYGRGWRQKIRKMTVELHNNLSLLGFDVHELLNDE
jgi:hypothetical protein